jgi:hypothetical protein
MSRWARALATAFVGSTAALAGSCRSATEITIVASTDIPCAELSGLTITTGGPNDVETKAFSTSAKTCDASGALGTIVLAPSAGKNDDVALKLVLGVGRDPASCTAPGYGKGCIVARREVTYVPHTGLRILVPLDRACDGVPCSETQTCVRGACASRTIQDPSGCAGSNGCGEGALGQPADGGAPDAALDATSDDASDASDAPLDDAGAPVTYNDVTDRSLWTLFDVSQLTGARAGFAGVVNNGRVTYLIPAGSGASGAHGVIARYAGGKFSIGASWSIFDVQAIDTGAAGFFGGVFDGRYIYAVPSQNTLGPDGVVARYDTRAAFTDAVAWTSFDTTTVALDALGFHGGAFDGQYVYFAPHSYGSITRYNTKGAFGSTASWETYDLSATTRGFTGAAFDGVYVYFVPNGTSAGANGLVVRYDAQQPFSSAGAWSTFDLGSVDPRLKGYEGAVFDGRYLHLIPGQVGANYSGLAARFDTQAQFTSASAWSFFDLTSVNPNAARFSGGTFDGRYVYYVPSAIGLLARYDTQEAFTATSSWSTLDLTTLDPKATAYAGAAFDGQYVSLAPSEAGPALHFRALSVLGPVPPHASFY